MACIGDDQAADDASVACTDRRRSASVSRCVRTATTLGAARSIDLANDVFSDYLVENMSNLWQRDHLDMEAIFGESWPELQLHLARYYAKHFGSLMVDTGIPAPPGLTDFLDGASHPRDCQMSFVKDEALHYGYEVMTSDGFDGIGLWISDADGWTDPAKKS